MKEDKIIEILKAYKDGKQIQCYYESNWHDITRPKWDFYSYDYRIKPEPNSSLLTPNELFEKGAIYVRRKSNNGYVDISIINNFTDKYITFNNQIIDEEYASFYEWTADRKTWNSFYRGERYEK